MYAYGAKFLRLRRKNFRLRRKNVRLRRKILRLRRGVGTNSGGLAQMDSAAKRFINEIFMAN